MDEAAAVLHSTPVISLGGCLPFTGLLRLYVWVPNVCKYPNSMQDSKPQRRGSMVGWITRRIRTCTGIERHVSWIGTSIVARGWSVNIEYRPNPLVPFFFSSSPVQDGGAAYSDAAIIPGDATPVPPLRSEICTFGAPIPWQYCSVLVVVPRPLIRHLGSWGFGTRFSRT